MTIQRSAIVFLCMFLLSFDNTDAGENPYSTSADGGAQARFLVVDADQQFPIELAHVVLRRNGRFVTQDATNPAGLVRFRDLEPGRYSVSAWFVGYKTSIDSILIEESHASYTLALHSEGAQEQEVEAIADRELAVSHIDPRTGNQVFE